MLTIQIIVGPTASGKTALAIKRALAGNGEIISVDSRQVYKGFVIGTSQPTGDELARVPHHLVNILDPGERITAGQYVNLIQGKIAELAELGKAPVLCGGTGLYVRALRLGLSKSGAADPRVRAAILARVEQEGAAAVHAELARIDPATAGRIHPNNIQRLVRALEIYETTGRPPSELREWEGDADEKTPAVPGVGAVQYELTGIKWPRDELYSRINERVSAMLEQGWVAEVEGLLQSGVSRSAHPMQGIGYRELASVVAGELPLDEAVPAIQQRTRNFARRQLTWFRKEPVEWIEAGEIWDR